MIRNRFKQTTSWLGVGAFVFSLSAVRSTPELNYEAGRNEKILMPEISPATQKFSSA
jgi:hypothetical protein